MSFTAALDFLLSPQIEGRYSNDPNDPGGETCLGISKRSYPQLDIAHLSRETVAPIYKRDFWDVLRCDELPPRLAFVVFIAAVNIGQPTAAMLLQSSLGLAKDGLIGPATLAAIAKQDANSLTRELVVQQILYYVNRRNFATYGHGWVRRAELTFETALTLKETL